jgi:hypothetical protein
MAEVRISIGGQQITSIITARSAALRSGARNRPDEFVSGLRHGKLCGVLRNLQAYPWKDLISHSEMIEVAKLLCTLRTPLTFVAVAAQ